MSQHAGVTPSRRKPPQYISTNRDNTNDGLIVLPIHIPGQGSDLGEVKTVFAKARRKLITSTLAVRLAEVAEMKGDKEILKSIWNTFHCQNQLVVADGRSYGKNCKNRFCTVCCGIKKADIINHYGADIQNWHEPYLVTLTGRSVGASSLKKRMADMLRGFKILLERHKKRHQRGKGIKWVGIKSLECNFNPEKKTYNPHFHLIVPDKETAEQIIQEWLTLLTKKFALRCAQDMRKVDSLDRALIEVIKYSTKVFTEPSENEPDSGKRTYKIYIRAMYNIIKAMKGFRIFERFGFNASKRKSDRIKHIKVAQTYDKWGYDVSQFNWVNNDGETLTDYWPRPELLHMLENGFDVIME